MWKQDFIKGTISEISVFIYPMHSTNFLNFCPPQILLYKQLCAICFCLRHTQKYFVRYMNYDFPQKSKFEKNCKYRLMSARSF